MRRRSGRMRVFAEKNCLEMLAEELMDQLLAEALADSELIFLAEYGEAE